jgi:hypothetical protein
MELDYPTETTPSFRYAFAERSGIAERFRLETGKSKIIRLLALTVSDQLDRLPCEPQATRLLAQARELELEHDCDRRDSRPPPRPPPYVLSDALALPLAAAAAPGVLFRGVAVPDSRETGRKLLANRSPPPRTGLLGRLRPAG